MISSAINRVLHVIYPTLVFGFVLLVWSSSSLEEVVAMTPPPVYDGFGFFWNPTLSSIRHPATHSGSSLEQLTNNPNNKTNQTN